MPKTRRVAALFGLFAISILCSGIAASQPPSPSPSEAAQPEQGQSTRPQPGPGGNQQTATQPPVIVHVHPAEKTEAERADEARERKEKAELDRRLVELTAELANFTAGLFFATIALFIATAGLAYFGWHQSRDMKASIAVSKKIGEAQVRSYLTVTGGTYDVWGESLRIEVHFQNVGASPARNISGQFYATISLWDDTRFPVQTYGCRDVAAQGAAFVLATLEETSDGQATRFFEYVSKSLGFGIEGHVAWDDVFDARNEQPFSLSSRFEKTKDGITSGRLDLRIISDQTNPKRAG